MAKRYWLFKSEPEFFSIDDLIESPNHTTTWDGVRNYQARNFLRDDVRAGDDVLFYHSNSQPSGVAGTCRVVRAGYPDPSALNPDNPYYVPNSDPRNPVWYAVNVKFVTKLSQILPLAVLRETPGLENMMVTRKGSRLSIQPVTPAEWEIVRRLMKHFR
jgi:predicted RNA-binding protein with PUA-like domain